MSFQKPVKKWIQIVVVMITEYRKTLVQPLQQSSSDGIHKAQMKHIYPNTLLPLQYVSLLKVMTQLQT